jgi:hypothetical protein
LYIMQAAEADEVLDAEALQQLLGGSGFNAKAAPTTGGGWAGSSFWKYKSAAAAIARLGGGSAATAKKAPAASGKARCGGSTVGGERHICSNSSSCLCLCCVL